MIKLFWNTHNQTKPDSYRLDSKEAINLRWGIYHKENSDKWIYEILKKIKFEKIESEENIKNEDVILIVDSSIENKEEFYNRLKLLCSRIFLIHLGDESGAYDLSPIYNNCNYVWRTFCLNKYFNNNKVSCLPIGYKSGTCFDEKLSKRKYKWAFIGTPHKSSRHDLLFHLSDIKPFFNHRTRRFNDGKIIQVNEMSKLLSLTQFIPCPNGFFHPETYRLYEALECGCIPIVENAYKYYDRLFPENPFLKVDRWIEAKLIIKDWKDIKIKKKQEECAIWWTQQKTKIQNLIKNKIHS